MEKINTKTKDEGIEIALTPEEMLRAIKQKLIETEAECQKWREKYMKLRDAVEETYKLFFS